MNIRELDNNEILSGYDEVSRYYPYVPPMTIWRAWEYAVYKHYELVEPVLDIGCGDGQFFRHIWPNITNAIGVDADSDTAKIAEQSGVYRQVHATPAHQLPVPPNSCKSAFANCSLEHMDYLPEVLGAINRSLCPGSPFLFSVVTDKFIEWSALPLLVEKVGEHQKAEELQFEYVKYHHLVNPFPPEKWIEHLNKAKFKVIEYWPIIPEVSSRLFLFVDQLWHVPKANGKIGDSLLSYLEKLTSFPEQFRKVLSAILNMEADRSICSGAVFWARKTK